MSATHFSGPVVSTNGFTGDLTGLALQGGSATAITTAGAIPVDTLFSIVWPDGKDGSASIVLTLADGEAGQMKIIKYDDGTVTTDVHILPANFADGYRFTLDAAGDTAILVFDGAKWHTITSDGTIDAAS